MYGASDHFGNGATGASQFGGGGFMASQNDAGGPSPAAKNQQNSRNREGMRSVTVKMLLDAGTAQYMDENQAFQEVTLVGKIAAVRHGAGDGNCIDFQLFDGTGGMQVQYYPDPESEDMEKAAELVRGAYVRVHGKVGEFEGRWRVQAFHVRLVTDFNEVTYHNLQAIFQAVHVAKGLPGSGRPLAEIQVDGGMAGQAGMAGGGYAGPVAAAAGGGGGPDDVGNDGLTNAQRQVLAVLLQPNHLANGAGPNVEQIHAECPGLSLKQVGDAVGVLQEDGRAYTASDEYHFKAAT